MRFVSATLITAIINYLLCLVLPWWAIAIGAATVALFVTQFPARSFLSGFSGGFIHWFLMAVLIDNANHQILSARVAGLFSLSQPFMMVLITALLSGLVSGLAALSTSLLRRRETAKPAAA